MQLYSIYKFRQCEEVLADQRIKFQQSQCLIWVIYHNESGDGSRDNIPRR